ncbi:MAG: diguanylate cyclase [Wenzhouxiangella sp.]|nr:MAG: diguanylate cyclase [Wenzhouxiangella sp.]
MQVFNPVAVAMKPSLKHACSFWHDDPRCAAGLGFALLLIMIALPLQAATLFDFERFSDQLGGRQSTVYDVFEDHQGFLWFAGDTDGLLRYDGYELMSWSEGFLATETRHNVSTQIMSRSGRLWAGSWGNGLQYWDPAEQRFVQFLHAPDDPHSLADNRVQTFLEDSRGRLWVGTVAGINIVDPEQPNQLRRFAADQPEHPLYRQRIWRLVEWDGWIWLATSNGVFRVDMDSGEWQRYLLEAGDEAVDHERSDEVRTVALAHGRVWAASQLGAFVWAPAQGRFERVEFAHDAARAPPRINELLESRSHGLWVGAHDGLYRIDAATSAFVQLGQRGQLIPDVDVRALHEDDEGNLWIGTRDQGLIFGRRQQQTFAPLRERMPPELAEAGGRLSSALLTDRRGRLWASFPGGILRQDEAGDWRSWRFDPRDGVRRVERLVEDARGWIWLATDGGLFVIDEADNLRAETRIFDLLGVGVLPVSELWIGRNGCLWIGLWHYGLACWQPDGDHIDLLLTELQQTRGDSIYQLASDDQDRLWVATRYAGLFSVDLEDHTVQRWPLVDGDRHEPSYYCAVPDEGRLWLCTGDGLIAFDPKSGRKQSYGTERGLPAARISGLFKHPSAGLWALTPNGLARQLPGRDRFVSYGLADGLPGLGLQRNAVTLDPSGRLLVGTNRGAAVLQDPELPLDYRAPQMVLSRVWIGREDLTRQLDPHSPEVRLAPDQRDLMLQFAVLDFHDPGRNVMRLKLNGLDEDFGPLTTERSVRYLNLAPGRYELVVEGWNSRGVQAVQPLVLSIVVAAPWWQLPWVWLLAASVLLVLIWLLVQARLHAMRSANARLQVMVDERTRALADANAQLRTQSTQDFLTGLLNRRGFTDRFNSLRQARAQTGEPLSLVLFDLDHFKELNDRHGHDAGDRVLRQVAEILGQQLPESALAARWGGEEFLIALDGLDSADAVAVCEQLRAAFRDCPVAADGTMVSFTATFGVVVSQAGGASLEDWMRQVDQALYEGKRAGRDRIRVHDSATRT